MINSNIVPLSSIGSLERGTGLQKSDFTPTGIPCIHYGQIFTYYGPFTNATISSVPTETATRCTDVRKGDIVMAITSENVSDLCKSTVWLGDEKIVTGAHSGVFRHNQNPRFVGYYFQTEFFNRQKTKYARGTKVIEISPADILSRIKIKLPDLETQQKIVSILDVWTCIIGGLDKIIEKEKIIFNNILSQIMALDAPIVRLGDIASMCSGGTPDSKNEKYYNGSILWASIADITATNTGYLFDTSKHLSEAGLASSSAIKIHPKGSVLYAMYASIGEVAIADKDMASSQAILGIRCGEKIINKYLYYYLKYNKKRIARLGQQGAQSNLNAGIVRKLKIPCPEISVQTKIIMELDAQTELIQYYEMKKNNLIKQYKYLLNHLMNGDFDLSGIQLEEKD